MSTDDLPRRVRETRRALHAAACACPHGVGCSATSTGEESDCDCMRRHDPYWVRCPRTLAELEFHRALDAAGFAL